MIKMSKCWAYQMFVAAWKAMSFVLSNVFAIAWTGFLESEIEQMLTREKRSLLKAHQ